MLSADVVIAGAGVSGSSIAFRLASAGMKVMLLDAKNPGAGASGSCDKAIFMQSKRPGIHMELALASRRMYDRLEDELNADIEFEAEGGMVLIETESQMEFMTGFIASQREAGIRVELMDAQATKQAQPFVADHILGASFSPDDADVNPLALNQGFVNAAVRLGTTLLTHTEVTGVISSGGKVTGVQTTAGPISTGLFINAAGPFAGKLGERTGVQIPITPRRGTILISEAIDKVVTGCVLDAQYIAAKHLHASTEDTPPFGVGLSLGQTRSGNLLIGGSREFEGFTKRSEAEVVATIANHAARIAPLLAQTKIIRTMTGFRPYTGDGLPIIDWAPELEGYLIAAGHEGDGLALAPLTGQLVADLLAGTGENQRFLEALTISRFEAAASM